MPNYYLFRCSTRTYTECLERKLFGQTLSMRGFVENINVGDILFLHQTGLNIPLESQFIEGPFWAVTDGQENIQQDAWGGDFPMQVRFEEKGKISRIKQKSFEDFSLNYSIPGRFFDFQIRNEIARKLMEEMGFEVDFEKKVIKDFNTLNDIDIDFRLRFPAKYRCEDGHYVRSISETLIDNWLFSHNIVHGYEKKIPGEFMTCDFFVRGKNNNKVYIEFWGLENNEVYLNRKKEKQDVYKKLKLNLINISNENIQNLDDYLGDKLKSFV